MSTNLKDKLSIIASGILYGLALNFVQFYLAWICLVPFFIAINGYKAKKAFYAGALMGVALWCSTFYWMPKTVFNISDKSIVATVFTLIAVPAIYAAYFGLITLCFSLIKAKKKALWINAILMAAIWTCGGYLIAVLFSGMPWFFIDIGNTMLGNLYAIQTATLGGIGILSFVVVLVNYLLAYFISVQQWKKTMIPIGIIVGYVILGFGIFSDFKKQLVASGKPVSVALVSGNIPADLKWDEENGDMLAKKLLVLNERALSTKPDIILWPEGIVSWPYRADDDFIAAVLKASVLNGNVCHVMGFKTVDSNKEVYNSAYFLLPDGTVGGRHDKHYLVSMAEKRIPLISSYFLKSANARDYFMPGKDNGVVATAHGNVGVLICSELFIPQATQRCLEGGAGILVSLSDDVLFADAFGIVNHQFYKNRLRAVEARKDIAISCNMGFSGMVNAAGEIVTMSDEPGGYTETVSLLPNKFLSNSALYSILFLCISAVVILIFCLFTSKTKEFL